MGEQSRRNLAPADLFTTAITVLVISNNALVESLLTHSQDFFKVVVLSQLRGKRSNKIAERITRRIDTTSHS